MAVGTGWRRAAAAAAWLLIGAEGVEADCTFSDLEWAGEAVRLRVHCAGDTRDAVVDIARGAPDGVDPRVREPVWCASRRSILFRDALGVFEVRAEPGAAARLCFFLPGGTPLFLRAFGADADGRLLVWVYDRDATRHELWTAAAGAAPGRERVGSGPEALAWWKAHDTGEPFRRAGGRYVRTACVRFGSKPERVCVEPTGRGTDGRPRFQLVLGRAGAMGEWARDVVPSGLAAAPDSSFAIVGLEEGGAAGGRATVWVVTPEAARRAATGGPASGFETRVRWLDSAAALWVDAAGALWRVGDGDAAALVPARPGPAPSVLHRLVVARTADADTAAAVERRLAAAGFEGARRRDGALWEVQAGATAVRAEAETRASALRARGFVPRLESGDAAAVAPGLAFGVALGTHGRRAFVRNTETSAGVVSELWLQDGAAPPRRVLAAPRAP
jgi:hypothetical protein